MPSDLSTPVNLHIISFAFEQEETLEQYVQGHMYRKNGVYYLTYIENMNEEEVNENVRVQNTLKIEKNSVKAIRQGAVRMHHIYHLGQTTQGKYETPLGTFDMETMTTQCQFQPVAFYDGKPSLEREQQNKAQKESLKDHHEKGELLLRYNLTLNQQSAGQFQLQIVITKARETD